MATCWYVNVIPLVQVYTLACKERWGTSFHEHVTDDGNQGVPLENGLATSSPCSSCGSDSDQWFSFCLNRFVNADRVHHCDNCGQCGYFRPGCIAGCEHCGFGDYYSNDEIQDPIGHLAYSGGFSHEKAEHLIQTGPKMFGRPNFDIIYEPGSRGCKVSKVAVPSTKRLAMEGYWGY